MSSPDAPAWFNETLYPDVAQRFTVDKLRPEALAVCACDSPCARQRCTAAAVFVAGGLPGFFVDRAMPSRVRSRMRSLSNWANAASMVSHSRPVALVRAPAP